jgi:hypothetical protein
VLNACRGYTEAQAAGRSFELVVPEAAREAETAALHRRLPRAGRVPTLPRGHRAHRVQLPDPAQHGPPAEEALLAVRDRAEAAAVFAPRDVITTAWPMPAARAEFTAVLAALRRTLGEDHLSTLTTRHNLAVVLHAQGEHAAARDELAAVLPALRRTLGEDHPSTLNTRHDAAVVGLRAEGEYGAARAEYGLETGRPR